MATDVTFCRVALSKRAMSHIVASLCQYKRATEPYFSCCKRRQPHQHRDQHPHHRRRRSSEVCQDDASYYHRPRTVAYHCR